MALDRRTFMNAGLNAGCLAALTAGAPLRAGPSRHGPLAVLDYARFAHHVERFNAMERERPLDLVPNAQAWDWIAERAPAFECPDAQVEEIYWYRWWTFRKALVRTPEGRVAPMEFYGRAPVSSAVGHHLMESRWLRDRAVAQDILLYWLRGGTDGSPPKDEFKYSGWTIWAAYQRWLVTGNTAGLAAMFDDFVRYYEGWERLRMNADGSFWQFDVRDAMEESISGSRRDRNLRPPLNSYMYGNAVAMAKITRLTGRAALAPVYEDKAKTLRGVVQDRLWDEQAQFFKVRYVHPGAADDDTLCDAREEIGFIPWYFDLPDAGRDYETAWAQLADPMGFGAPHGILTAERRHPRFRYSFAAACEWNGPVWPFATSQTLTALANVLCSGRPAPVSARDYFHALRTYARSQYRDGKPYIGEYLDGETGLWLHKDLERGRYYNHSTYCDLVINGLVGLRPEPGGRLVVQPQVPQGTWDWFCLDGVPFQGRLLTVMWDRDGSRYRRGAGLTVLANGERIARSRRLERLSARIG